MAERYDRARARVPGLFRDTLSELSARITTRARRSPVLNAFCVPEVVDGCIEGRPVRVLIGATGGDLHVSVSRTDARRGRIGPVSYTHLTLPTNREV